VCKKVSRSSQMKISANFISLLFKRNDFYGSIKTCSDFV
jgi:hypothetical protein